MQGVQTRIPGYAPTFSGFGPRGSRGGAGRRGPRDYHSFIDGWSVRDGMYGAMDGSRWTAGGYERRTRRTDAAHEPRSFWSLSQKPNATCQNAECRISLPKSRA